MCASGKSETIHIDGSMGEGGGSVVRLALAFSLLVKKPVFIQNIRKSRPKPGLAHQHLAGIKALEELSGSRAEGAKLGSTELRFFPGCEWRTSAVVDISTAGSIGLFSQQLQIAALAAGTEKITVEVRGGATFGKWAPTALYLEHVLFNMLRQLDYRIGLQVLRHGFYPRGGARVLLSLHPPARLKPLKLSERRPESSEASRHDFEGAFFALSVASSSLKQRRVAERQIEGIEKTIVSAVPALKLNASITYADAACAGSGVCVWCAFPNGVIMGSDAVGEKGLAAERVGGKAAELLLEDLSTLATCDRFASDQLIPFMALAGSSSIVVREITKHARTNMELIRIFFGKCFSVQVLGGDRGYRVSID